MPSGSDVNVYFLWKQTPHGSVKVSHEGLGDFMKRLLSKKCRLRGLSMLGGDEPSVTLVLSSDAAERDERLEQRLSSASAPLGLMVQVIWVDRNAPRAEWRETQASLLKNPWTWMLAASTITLVVKAGWNGFFWTMFWGTAAWFAARFLPVLFRGKKLSNAALRR